MGIGLVAMGEDLGSAMAGRALDHLLQYGDAAVRWAAEDANMFVGAESLRLCGTSGTCCQLVLLSAACTLAVCQGLQHEA